MATPDLLHSLPAPVPEHGSPAATVAKHVPAFIRGSKVEMLLDGLTCFCAAIVATLLELHTNPIRGVEGFWRGTLIPGRSMGILLALLCGFTATLILTSRRLHLYRPRQFGGFLHEQRLTLQACFISMLLLTGTLYVVHANDIPQSIVVLTVALLAAGLSIRRLACRVAFYHRLERGLDTRNVFIVGLGPEAQAFRHHLEHIPRLGYRFKGFIASEPAQQRAHALSHDVAGTLDTLFQQARRHFVDEIFFTTRCEQKVMHNVLEKARGLGIDVRVVPDTYYGLAWNSPIEYIGKFPTIALHRRQVSEIPLIIKRFLDITLSATALALLSPLLLLTALLIRLDSPGPIFYCSERIGKKGHVFRCIKFRTMICDAERMRAEIMHMNERDGVLFKVSNDPRITRVGRILRKYSLDELPQFFNVLRAEMSIVGPRPPIASEVREYKLSQLRRLDVTPGITGLWQVEGRQDPSFDSYISLDMRYIENWSLWLDVKIMVRTAGVLLAGTGS